MNAEYRIAPEPSDEDRAAILRAVKALIDREDSMAQLPLWRRAFRSGHGSWRLSQRIPPHARAHVNMYGRGDAR